MLYGKPNEVPPKDKQKQMSFKNVSKNTREVANQDDEMEGGSDDWNPTPAIFEGFLKRDFDLCSRNMRMILNDARGSMTFKSLKECLLHSADVIERVITSQIASGKMVENKGNYSLVANR